MSYTLVIAEKPSVAANIAAAEGLGIAGYLFDHRNPAAACGELRRRLL